MTTNRTSKTTAAKPDTKTVTTRKAPAKATTTRRKAPAKTAAPKVQAPTPKVKKSDLPEWERDYTYLADKAPTALHEDFAAWMTEAAGLEFDSPEEQEAFLKGVQMAAVLRGVYQRSPRNKGRGDYRPLATEVVEQRSLHMIAAHQDAAALREASKAKAEATAKAAADKRKAAAAKRAAAKA